MKNHIRGQITVTLNILVIDKYWLYITVDAYVVQMLEVKHDKVKDA